MLGASETITETIKQVIQSLQIRFLFPAIVFVVVNVFLFPDFGIDSKFGDNLSITFSVISIILLSYLFSAFNGLIIRLAEGYELSENWIYLTKKIFQQNKFNKLNEQIDKHVEIINEIGSLYNALRRDHSQTDEERRVIKLEIDEIKRAVEVELNDLRAYKNLCFHDKKIFPTNIGNTIAAFEDYPKTRYGMDSVYLWPRMLPILKDKKFLEFVQNEKTTMDFLLNLGLVSLVVSTELLVFSQSSMCVAGFFLAYVCYYAANAVAIDWGTMVCSAFDLYREDLRKALYLPEIPAGSLKQEKEQWERISQFIVFAETNGFDEATGFNYGVQSQSKICREAS